MKRRNIVLAATAGIAFLSIGGNILGILGVTAIFLAVWGINENGRLADWDHDVRNAYPGLMAQPRPADRVHSLNPKPTYVSVLS